MAFEFKPNYLKSGYSWTPGVPLSITFLANGQLPSYYGTGSQAQAEALNVTQISIANQASVYQARDSWSRVANIKWKQPTGDWSNDITIAYTSTPGVFNALPDGRIEAGNTQFPI